MKALLINQPLVGINIYVVSLSLKNTLGTLDGKIETFRDTDPIPHHYHHHSFAKGLSHGGLSQVLFVQPRTLDWKNFSEIPGHINCSNLLLIIYHLKESPC